MSKTAINVEKKGSFTEDQWNWKQLFMIKNSH